MQRPRTGISPVSVSTLTCIPENHPGTGAFMKRDGMPHPHPRPVDIDRSSLGMGSKRLADACLAGAEALELGSHGVRLDTTGAVKVGNETADKAWTTRNMGKGITQEMNGYACKSAWAREQILRSIKDLFGDV